MATFEEANRLRLEGEEALSEYGEISNLSVVRQDTSYVLLAIFKGRYKKRPPEDLHIGTVKVVAVKEGDEDVVQAVQGEGPKNLQHADPALQYLDEPDNLDGPPAVPDEEKKPVEEVNKDNKK